MPHGGSGFPLWMPWSVVIIIAYPWPDASRWRGSVAIAKATLGFLLSFEMWPVSPQLRNIALPLLLALASGSRLPCVLPFHSWHMSYAPLLPLALGQSLYLPAGEPLAPLHHAPDLWSSIHP